MKLFKNLKLPKLSSAHILLFIVCIIALIVILYYKKNRDGFTANIKGNVYGNQNEDFNKIIGNERIPEPLFNPRTQVALGYISTIKDNWADKRIGRIYRYKGRDPEYKGFYVCVFKGVTHIKLSYFKIISNTYTPFGVKYVEYKDGIRGKNSSDTNPSNTQNVADLETFNDQQSFTNNDSPDNIGLWPPNRKGIDTIYKKYKLAFIKVFSKQSILQANQETINATKLNEIKDDTPSFSVLKSAIQLETINKKIIQSSKRNKNKRATIQNLKQRLKIKDDRIEKQRQRLKKKNYDIKKQKENHADAMKAKNNAHAATLAGSIKNAIKTTRDMYDTFFTYNKTIETGSKDDCMSKCIEKKYDDNTRKYDDAECETSCTTWNNKKQFSEPPYELIESFTTEDVTHGNCIDHCLNEDYPPQVCLRDCEKWAIQHNKKLENCFFRPGGLTPGDCKTRCEDYYNIVDPNDTVCKSTCEDVCKKCDTADCKWTNFQSEEEFPYQLSIFGVASNGKVTLSWEKPPYAVKKYIIMYFEEEQQHTKGVYFEEKLGNECNQNETYCSHVVTGLINNKNYIMGISVIFQSNDVTRMSNRIVMRPTRIITNEVEQSEKPKENKQESKAQTRTPAQILSAALLREKRKANSQKILTDFKKSQAEQISDLFSYLATNPINLQFKLS